MANQKISAMPVAIGFTDVDIFTIVQGGVNKQIPSNLVLGSNALRSDLVTLVAGGYTASNGVVVAAGGVQYLASSGATDIPELLGWLAYGVATVDHWGAIGDYDGTVVTTDSTTAIDDALDWWAAVEGRHLTISAGWYYYNGNKTVDLNDKYAHTLDGPGQITFASITGVGWEIHNSRLLTLDLTLRNGGALGDFSDLVAVGGSTAIQIHRTQFATINIRHFNYMGRALHMTAKAPMDDFARNIRASIDMHYGNRALAGDDARSGQPICWDTGTVANIGGAGEITLNGSACEYGALFADMNDLAVHAMETGPFIQQGVKFQGITKLKIGDFWCGESDVTNPLPILTGETSARGTKCGSWIIDSLRTLRSASEGCHFKDFDPNNPGTLRINNVECTTGDVAITLEDVPDAHISGIAVKDCTTAVKIVGACGRLQLEFDDTDGITGITLDHTGTVSDELVVSGRIDGGAATFPLISLSNNNTDDVVFQDLHLESSVASLLVSFGLAGPNKVRWIGGSVAGTTQVFTTAHRPERVSSVRGLQSESVGTAVILNTNTEVTFNHNLAFLPSVIILTGITTEVGGVYVSASDDTTATAKVDVAVTADRTVNWIASAVTLANDADA